MRRTVFSYYAICKPGTPKIIVETWPECEKLTKGVKGGVKFRGFCTAEEAMDWDPENGAILLPQKQKTVPEDATLFKSRMERARQEKLAVVFVDGSHIAQKRYCAIGIYSPNAGLSVHETLPHLEFTNQRTELYAIHRACHLYDTVEDICPGGLCIFTDSQWSQKMLFEWAPNYIRKNLEFCLIYPELPPREDWVGTGGERIKHQDLAKSILAFKEKLEQKGKQFRLHWIPRALNGEADRLSKKGVMAC